MPLAAAAYRAGSSRSCRTVSFASASRSRRATTIGLTVVDSPVSAAVKVPLALGVFDEGDILTPTTLRYAFLTIIDILSYGVAIRSGAQAQEKLRRIKQQFTTFRDADDKQPASD